MRLQNGNGIKKLTIADLLDRPAFKIIKPAFLSHSDPSFAYPPEYIHPCLFHLHADVGS